jgi:DNA-binding transcriptional LysR family regulator
MPLQMAIKNKLISAANFRDFDWNKAKLFYHIAKCGGLVKAAKIAGTDQPALTRQIQALEKQVGRPLLIRKGGGIILTRKGEELMKLVAPFFREVKGFCGNSYVEIAGEYKRKIRIVTTNAIAAYIIGDLLVAYNRDNPHLVFEVMGQDPVVDVILSDADIAIGPHDSDAVNLHQELLFSLERKLYASQEYLEKYEEPKTVEDLKDHRLIACASNQPEYAHAPIHWILKLGMPEGKKHEPIFLSNSIECMVNAAKEGLGIIGSYETMSIIKNSNLKQVLPDVREKKVDFYFSYPNYFKDDADIREIKQYLGQCIKS